MRPIVTGKKMKQLDAHMINQIGIPSLVLMERAAFSVCQVLKTEAFPLERVLVLCGNGNNGADGAAIARILHLEGISSSICLLGEPAHDTEEMKKQVEIAEKCHVSFVKNPDLGEYTTIVDAILGVGLSREVGGIYREYIQKLNNTKASILSVDIPSGIQADNGSILGCAVKAKVTVTFAFCKAGLIFHPGAGHAGKIVTADIGIREMPDTRFSEDFFLYSLDKEDWKCLPKRNPDGNKGTFGKVLLIAGSRDIAGAAALSGTAAMRTGAGMIKIHTREENRASLVNFLPEAMFSFYGDNSIEPDKLRESMNWADVIGIGPGLGTSGQADELLKIVLEEGKKTLVIDADGLNLLKNHINAAKSYPSSVLITPHLGEFSRLFDTDISRWKEDPLTCTQTMAREFGFHIICKDSRTLISDGTNLLYVNTTGNNGMATAGSGDVLTGILLGLLSQGILPQKAAPMAVCLHGCAGDLAKMKTGEDGLLARDLITGVCELLKKRGTTHENT